MGHQVSSELSTDRIEQMLLHAEASIAQTRAAQIALLAELDRRQVATADGCRTMAEWVGSRLDVAPETASALVTLAKRLENKPLVAGAVAVGDISFDRALSIARGDEDDLLWFLDIPGIRRRVARKRRYDDERLRFAEQYLAVQPTLDGAGGRIFGELVGMGFAVVDRALTERADTVGCLPDGTRLPRRHRAALALVAMAEDSLGGGSEATSGVTPQVAILVDATPGPLAAEVAYGPRVGSAALEAALCTGSVQVIGLERGLPVLTSPSARAIPPAVRRFVAWRDGACCADGCTSRYRLQPHHVNPRHQGGSHDPDNLRTLCWFHHHVVIHGHGYRIDPDSPTGRTRFLAPAEGRAPPADRYSQR